MQFLKKNTKEIMYCMSRIDVHVKWSEVWVVSNVIAGKKGSANQILGFRMLFYKETDAVF